MLNIITALLLHGGGGGELAADSHVLVLASCQRRDEERRTSFKASMASFPVRDSEQSTPTTRTDVVIKDVLKMMM